MLPIAKHPPDMTQITDKDVFNSACPALFSLLTPASPTLSTEKPVTPGSLMTEKELSDCEPGKKSGMINKVPHTTPLPQTRFLSTVSLYFVSTNLKDKVVGGCAENTDSDFIASIQIHHRADVHREVVVRGIAFNTVRT